MDTNLKFYDYQVAASRTMGGDNNNQTQRDRINCWALGIAGEAGEVADLIKKYHFHNKTFDKDKLIKEMGDVLWYIAAMCEELHINIADVAIHNIKKLEARYPTGFNYEAANNRING